MKDREPACLAETLKWEGLWSNDPRDPGGPTMKGVIQREYDRYRRSKGLPTRTVRVIEQDELLEIYRTGYWDPVRGDDLPAGVDLCLFDFAVNSGPGRAIMSCQHVLGIGIDGKMGDATVKAIKARDPVELCRALVADRLRFLRALGTFRHFGVGWTRRCQGIEAAAVAAAGAVPETIAAAPNSNPDRQSKSQGRAVGLFTIPAADGPEGYEYKGHPEADDQLKQESPSYSLFANVLKALGLPATLAGGAATAGAESGLTAYSGFLGFFKEHGFKLAIGVVVVIVAFEVYQYTQRKKVMDA